MSTITSTQPGLTASVPNVKQIKWALGSADTGTGVMLADFPDKTVTMIGTWGGATIVLQGSNDGVNYITMTDPQGNALSKSADAIEAVLENPLYIQAVSSGGSGTAVNVILTCRKNA